MLGVDGQVRDLPDVGIGRQDGHALLDGVLVGPGERRVDQFADVGMARVNGQLGAVLRHLAHGFDVVQVEGGVHALGEQVQGQGDHVDVAGPFAVAEQGAFHPVGAGHDAELGGRDGGAAIVVGMQAEHDRVAVADGPPEPLDQIGVEVRRVHLHRGRQVEDDGPFDGRLDDIHHRFADLDRVVALGAGEALRRVLVGDGGVGQPVLHRPAQPGRVDGDVGDPRPVLR